ncbi:MAG: TRAP transporter small permease subunit [Alphaproteobacteria bacterium]|nr:TRAP transporter small permease subunit [Alphaproteobacteria bacterium]
MTQAAQDLTGQPTGHAFAPQRLAPWIRVFGLCSAVLVAPFLLNNYLIYWHDWPGLSALFAHLGAADRLEIGAVWRGWVQVLLYLTPIVYVAVWVLRTPDRSLNSDSERLSAVSLYIVRAAFWAVLLVGLTDAVISFMRVEGFLVTLLGTDVANMLGRSTFRGTYIHYPLVGISMVIAYFSRALGFIWLAFMIVMAEFMIVIFRFVFSYEQAFMSDIVRFWYAALFLFASAYTLMEGAHVRVDILYTRFTAKGKAWTNAVGSMFLGVPLCWVILTRGMAGKANLINAPLLSFETTQTGYGMFVKYLMAGFLVVYAVSMLVQFAGYFLSSAGTLIGEPEPLHEDHPAVT